MYNLYTMKKLTTAHFSRSFYKVLSLMFVSVFIACAAHAEEDAERTRIQKEIVKINNSLTQLQAESKKTEQNISKIKKNISDLEIKEQRTRLKLKTDVHNFYLTLMNMVRLERIPTEAIIAQDIVHVQLKRQALLNVSRDILDDEMVTGKGRLESLIATLNAQAESKKQLETEYNEIRKKEQHMLALLEQQKTLFAANKEERKALIKNAKFMEGATSLEELFSRHGSLLSDKMPSLNTKVSQIKLPLSGDIITAYQEEDKTTGLHAQGVTFLGSQKQAVKAIKSGRVIYSGPFRGYGYLVILEHPDNLHSLYAGFKESPKKVGDVVNVAETIAHLSTAQKPTLYFEVRKDGQAIDPVPYITK